MSFSSRLLPSHDEAKVFHQNYYKSDFDVIPLKNSGPLDFPPLSLFHGIQDIGCWDGFISTDGQKIVITRSEYFNINKASQVFEIQKTEVESIVVNVFKINLRLKKHVPKLTNGSNLFQFRPDDSFGNLIKFKSMLGT